MGLDAMGIGSIADLIKDGIDKIFPNPAEAAAAKIALLNAQNAGALKSLDDQFNLNIEQIKANAVDEAKPGLSFRDGAGWVCVIGFAIATLKSPIEWAASLSGHPVTLPSVDTATSTTMLFALLGIGGMHVYEQTQK
jgi:Holin of 3TMs, for gene-transfer release